MLRLALAEAKSRKVIDFFNAIYQEIQTCKLEWENLKALVSGTTDTMFVEINCISKHINEKNAHVVEIK